MQEQNETPEGISRENMRPEEAARYTRVSVSKLAKLRLVNNRKDGPAFIKLSGCIVYRKQDLDEWLERCRVSE